MPNLTSMHASSDTPEAFHLLELTSLIGQIEIPVVATAFSAHVDGIPQHHARKLSGHEYDNRGSLAEAVGLQDALVSDWLGQLA